MADLIRDYLPWLLSAITIWMTLLAGNLHRNAWLVGLANQLLWLVWIVVVGAWGLLPLNVALWIVYGRNHLKWRQPAPKPSDDCPVCGPSPFVGIRDEGCLLPGSNCPRR